MMVKSYDVVKPILFTDQQRAPESLTTYWGFPWTRQFRDLLRSWYRLLQLTVFLMVSDGRSWHGEKFFPHSCKCWCSNLKLSTFRKCSSSEIKRNVTSKLKCHSGEFLYFPLFIIYDLYYFDGVRTRLDRNQQTASLVFKLETCKTAFLKRPLELFHVWERRLVATKNFGAPIHSLIRSKHWKKWVFETVDSTMLDYWKMYIRF